ncbi:MAG: DUF5676 family membrane protein [Candidatus Komeilibacteria bacterium]|nr:DUF5676 family membrane protein [Candidatus Komeilibacteria bacterium]
MINTRHLLKVTAAWISIVYVICYAVVAIFPQSRDLFVRFSLHSDPAFGAEYLGVGYFISGLIVWNIVTVLAVWLFAFLFNKIKK